MKNRIVILAFGLLLLAAACGGGEEPAATPRTEAPVVTTEAPAAEPAGHVEEGTHDDEMGTHDEEMGTHDDEMGTHEGADHEGHEDGDAHAVAEADVDRVIEVSMTEFAFDPGIISVAAGETVRFVVTNAGAIDHEFRVTTRHAAEEHIASGHEGHHGDDEGSSEGHEHGEIVHMVAPGETVEVDVTFAEAGEYDLVACLLPGHFEAGMEAELTYEA